jgi:hypothetical protein
LEVQGGGRPGPGHADTADKAGNRWPTCCWQGTAMVGNGYRPKLRC